MQRTVFLFRKGTRYLTQNGLFKTIEKILKISRRRWKLWHRSKKWVASEEILKKQRETFFEFAPFISIVVPLFNTPEQFLREMLDSVCAQSYANWQLCMTDSSDAIHQLEVVIQQYVMQYPEKIKYSRLKNNEGISENTNQCIFLADGNYIALLDHDDVLALDALFEAAKVIVEQHADLVYTDEAIFSKKLNHLIYVHFKPDFAIDNLRANNYICHFALFKKSLLKKTGLFRKEYDGSQDHDMMLRLTNEAENIVHIPKVLYYWRAHSNSVAADINTKAYAINAGKKAVLDHLYRQGLKAEVESSNVSPTIYRIKYEIVEKSLISIIILNRNNFKRLQSCVKSIFDKSTYPNYEIIIMDYGSTDKLVFSYYKEIEKRSNIRVIQWQHPFNYSAINNYGVQHAKGKYLLLLHSDTNVITLNWMEEMLMYAQRMDVGAVGAKLYYTNDTIQYGGIILGLGKERMIGYVYDKFHRYDVGYMGRLYYAQDMSAVTTACMMMKKSLYEEKGGLDESFPVAFSDVDLCLRLRKEGYLVVFTPYTELYHYNSEAYSAADTLKNAKLFQKEIQVFKERWARELAAGDPYYNPNLTLDKADFSLK